jgi:hypothetical protein
MLCSRAVGEFDGTTGDPADRLVQRLRSGAAMESASESPGDLGGGAPGLRAERAAMEPGQRMAGRLTGRGFGKTKQGRRNGAGQRMAGRP